MHKKPSCLKICLTITTRKSNAGGYTRFAAMGGHRRPTFEEEIQRLDKNSDEYRSIVSRHEAIKRAEEEKRLSAHKMILRILELTAPVKELSVSRLSQAGNTRLLEIGKAARALNDALRKAGLLEKGYNSNKWS
jgi:hypothetical protein